MSKIRSTFSKLFSKPNRKWTIAVLAVLVVGFFGFRWWRNKQSELPDGIAAGNGRIESTEVDVSSKEPLRVKEILVKEGDLVKKGQVVVRMDTVTLEAELAESERNVAAAQAQLAVAKAAISRRGSEIELANIEKDRSQKLVDEHAGAQRELDVRTMTVKTTSAGKAEEQAKLQVALEQVKVGEANVAKVQSRIDDATLTSPVMGRVLYRLSEPGEVLGPGGKALTLVNLEDVYMEIFLPSQQASKLKIGAEARLKVDYEPDRVAAGTVSFVSPEAQFTPKQVETKSEREKLMFRVKIQVPPDLVMHYIERIKTGVRGVGYVKVSDNAVWPAFLQNNLVNPNEPPASTTPTTPTAPTTPPATSLR